jgi:hypothetical protein
MKSDYNGLVEQSEMNQSVDENFNNEFKGGAYRKADNTQQFSLFYHRALHVIRSHIRSDPHLMNDYISLCRSIYERGEKLWGSEKPAEEDDSDWM